MKAYLACFDISDDRVRYRVVKKLGAYGDRVQMSVFEISVKTPAQLTAIRKELHALLEPGDKLYFYHICLSCRKKSLDSANEPLMQWPAVVIV